MFFSAPIGVRLHILTVTDPCNLPSTHLQVTSCIDHLVALSPRLLRRSMSPAARRPSAEGAGEHIDESGFFDHSTSLPTSPTVTPTDPPRRTSSISDLVTSPLVTTSASVVNAAASYMLTNTM